MTSAQERLLYNSPIPDIAKTLTKTVFLSYTQTFTLQFESAAKVGGLAGGLVSIIVSRPVPHRP